MNISNKLKTKVINHENIAKEEVLLFLKYIVNKNRVITEHMPIKNYNSTALLTEICYSYNLLVSPSANQKFIIVNISHQEYLIDPNYNSARLPSLRKNKFIEYTSDVAKKYLEDW